MPLRLKNPLSSGEFKEWDALLYNAASDAEKVPSVRRRETTVVFHDIGRNGQSRSIELVGEKKVTARETLCHGASRIGERDGLLIDDQLLEGERHAWVVTERKETVER